jgi:hypothetical protein
MNSYIAKGRSTVGAPQKNEVNMSVDKASSGGGGGKKKGKKGKNNSAEEVALAKDPSFD